MNAFFITLKAEWQSGYAAACKAVDAGSIPTPASKFSLSRKARVAKLVDARDLKSLDHYGRAGSTPAPGTIKINNLLALVREALTWTPSFCQVKRVNKKRPVAVLHPAC